MKLIFLVSFFYVSFCVLWAEDPFQEFKVKRKNVFEFTKKPELTHEKDKTTISFAVKDFCDVTVAVENNDGKIIRHLASGVLGDKAPVPFLKNSLEQSVVWDNKDDVGKYVDDLGNVKIRVSLGLKAEYEKDLYYSPYLRVSALPVFCVAPEGLYVYQGLGRDHIRFFNRDGVYEKTIYPFPASQINNVNGLKWWTAPNGNKLLDKESMYNQTLLTSGDSAGGGKNNRNGQGVTALAIHGKKLALTFEYLNRLTTDGNTGGLPLKGEEVCWRLPKRPFFPETVGPDSTVFSPDGKTLYMTGYNWHSVHNGTGVGFLNAILKLNYETNEPVSVFVGEKEKAGDDNLHFSKPTSVDVDKLGNVYVSDANNNRVQIFDSNGKYLSTIKVNRPSKVAVHQKTGEIFVFSWGMYMRDPVPGRITIFNAYPDLKQKRDDPYPFVSFSYYTGFNSRVALDSWSEEPSFWLVYRGEGIRRISLRNGKWVEVLNLDDLAKKDILRLSKTSNNIQQLYFNPKTEKLYVGEPDSSPTGKAWTELIEIEPETAKAKLIKLPINPQDMAFDHNGAIYLRTSTVISRFDMNSWKEVPFDYGEERASVGKDGGIGGVASPVVSAIMLPGSGPVCHHQGGMDVNFFGDIVVACHNRAKGGGSDGEDVRVNKVYQPPGYPGRLQGSTSVCVHVWDKYGKVKAENVIKGAPQTDGLQLDKDNNIYMLATPNRMINGKSIDDGMSSTLIKFSNENNGKFLYSGEAPIILPESQYPKRPPELKKLWVENYEWMYGGCGFGGFNDGAPGGGCACWFVRFKLDFFARSFVPEPMQYDVAVLDSAGNLILKIGQYGNEDSRGKNSKEPLGGDEVGLFHPSFVTVHSDRRLFISDIGNGKILSVKLNYEVNETVTLKK